jgi:hypothetical protein
LRAINYFDIKGFINTLSAVSSGHVTLPLYTLTNELSDENWSYSLLGRDEDFFDLAVSPKGVVVVTFKDSPNYESKSTYSLVLKVIVISDRRN